MNIVSQATIQEKLRDIKIKINIIAVIEREQSSLLK